GPGLGAVRRRLHLAVLLRGDLAARAPDEADDAIGEVARCTKAVCARELLHQQLGVGDQLGPRGGRRADACLGELVLAVPDPAHAAEPRLREVAASDRVILQVARNKVRAVRPRLDIACYIGERALALATRLVG